MQRVAPYQTGNAGWKDGASVVNNGNQASQEVVPTSHAKTESNSSLSNMVDTAMKNVKITPPKGKLSSNRNAKLALRQLFEFSSTYEH